MTKAKKAAVIMSPHMPTRDPATEHPEAYLAGQATAQRMIDSPEDRGRVPWALRLVEARLAVWPRGLGKNGLTELQYARSCGFRDTLMQYLAQNGE